MRFNQPTAQAVGIMMMIIIPLPLPLPLPLPPALPLPLPLPLPVPVAKLREIRGCGASGDAWLQERVLPSHLAPSQEEALSFAEADTQHPHSHTRALSLPLAGCP